MIKTKHWAEPMDATLKRVFDVTVAAVATTCLLPLAGAIAVAIKLDDHGPVFYHANRVGLHGNPFRLYKFRTMYVGADRQGAAVTSYGDRRVTKVGRFLRRTKLDELPQLINVLVGDMSLVGPRPEDPRYVAIYTPEQRRVLQVRPGITSAASLAYRNEEQLLVGEDWESLYRSQIMPAKLALDLEYVSRRTLLSDMVLIFRTIAALFH